MQAGFPREKAEKVLYLNFEFDCPNGNGMQTHASNAEAKRSTGRSLVSVYAGWSKLHFHHLEIASICHRAAAYTGFADAAGSTTTGFCLRTNRSRCRKSTRCLHGSRVCCSKLRCDVRLSHLLLYASGGCGCLQNQACGWVWGHRYSKRRPDQGVCHRSHFIRRCFHVRRAAFGAVLFACPKHHGVNG